VTAAEALRSSAAQQAALVRSGELSARELVEASLAAIERLDRAVNAFASSALSARSRRPYGCAQATSVRCVACRSR